MKRMKKELDRLPTSVSRLGLLVEISDWEPK
jgi:hypothetical protein